MAQMHVVDPRKCTLCTSKFKNPFLATEHLRTMHGQEDPEDHETFMESVSDFEDEITDNPVPSAAPLSPAEPAKSVRGGTSVGSDLNFILQQKSVDELKGVFIKRNHVPM
jgi:hypothetical protein